jgi:hypothetical protein
MLEDFDFDHQRSVKRDHILHLATLDFITAIGNHRYQNVLNDPLRETFAA